MDTTFVNSGIYMQLLGGVVLERRVDYGVISNDPDPGFNNFNAGFAVAATAGVVVLGGLSLEADALYTQSDPNYYIVASTTSLMANAKYTLALNDSFSVYAAAGVGMIWYYEDQPSPGVDTEASGLGYQLIAGASAALTEDISLLGEVRYQVTILAGLKFAF